MEKVNVEGTPKVWLVTGSASGLGRSIAEAALEAGHHVVATARDPGRLDELVARYGGRIRSAALDVTDADAAQAAVATALDAFGRLDVLVNNAGYGDIRPFEQTSPEDFRRLVDTCFYGVVHLTRAALPILRRQRRGHIFQISSVGGRFATAGSTSYHAAKWAVGGFTEALALETAPFGVQVCALEPGSMRTRFGKRATGESAPLLPDYEPSVGAILRLLADHWGHENGDPAKVARVLLRLAECDRLPAHLLLGSDALHMAAQAEQARAEDAQRWYETSVSTDAHTTVDVMGLRLDQRAEGGPGDQAR